MRQSTLSRLEIHHPLPTTRPRPKVLANLVVVLVLCFYRRDTTDESKWEDVGYRSSFIAICQLPLTFLLAGRQNTIGFLADMSYAQLNCSHRWMTRTLWLTTTIHMGFWFRNWGRYDHITYQLKNDLLIKRGFAWCILTLMMLASLTRIRRLSYEVFVLQHLVTFIGLISRSTARIQDATFNFTILALTARSRTVFNKGPYGISVACAINSIVLEHGRNITMILRDIISARKRDSG